MYVEYQPTNTASQRNLHRKGLRRTVPGKAPLVDAPSSDTDKILNIADILLQATDIKTGQVKLFVEWDDRPLAAASWIQLRSLNKDTAQWWNLLKEVRYPFFSEDMFPKLLLPEDQLSDLDQDTISESPAYPSASSDEDINAT